MPIKANTPMFSLTIKPANSSKFAKKPITPKILFRLRTLMREGRSNPQCAYWSFSSSGRLSSGMSSRGRWSSKGCELKGFHPAQKHKLVYDYLNCSCDRLNGIAVLMDISSTEVVFVRNYFSSLYYSYCFFFQLFVPESTTQHIVSYVCIITSLLLLAITFAILSIIRGLQTNSNSIHRNLICCLFMAELLFLLALKLRGPLIQREVYIILYSYLYDYC